MIDWPDASLADLTNAAGQFARNPSVSQLATLGLTELCIPVSAGGLGPEALSRVLEVMARSHAGFAALLLGHCAAQLAWYRDDDPPIDTVSDAPCWAWPGFHDFWRHEWPTVRTDGHVTGELGACLGGAFAHSVVTPVRLAEGHLALFRFAIRQPGVSIHTTARFMGLQDAGIAHLELTRAAGELRTESVTDILWRLEAQISTAIIALLCGLMHGSLKTAQDYARERYQGGGPLLGWGEVRRLLAMQHERHLQAEALLSSALRALNHPHTNEQRVAQIRALLLQATQAATALTTDGIQLLGGNGFMKDYGQEQRTRDAWQLSGLLGPVAQRRQALLSLQLGESSVR